MSCLKTQESYKIYGLAQLQFTGSSYRGYIEDKDMAMSTENMLLKAFLLASYDKWEIFVLSWLLCNRLFITLDDGALEVCSRHVNEYLMRWQPETLHLHHVLPVSNTLY